MTITRNFSVLANGTGSANNLSLGGATLGSNALAVTGTTDISSTLNFGGFAAEGTVTAATTTNLGTSTANRQSVTGNTTITGFGTSANSYRIIRFTGTPLITYNATSLITPTKANIQAAPGDVATLVSDGSGNWTITNYQPCGDIVSSVVGIIFITSAANITSISIPPGKWLVSATSFTNFNTSTSTSGHAIGITSADMTTGTYGISRAYNGVFANGYGTMTFPPFAITLTATTTYYYVGTSNDIYGGWYGSIQAQRIF